MPARIVESVDVAFIHRIVKNVDSALTGLTKKLLSEPEISTYSTILTKPYKHPLHRYSTKIGLTWIHRWNLEHLFGHNALLFILHTAHIDPISNVDLSDVFKVFFFFTSQKLTRTFWAPKCFLSVIFDCMYSVVGLVSPRGEEQISVPIAM